MATDITAIRYLGNKPGSDIFDVLLTEEAAALARGFGELNAQSVTHREVVVETPYISGLRMGKILYAHESLSGKPIIGRVVGIYVFGEKRGSEGGGPSLQMRLTLECPLDLSDE